MNGSQTLVVKLGTSVLTGGSLRLNRAHIVELVRQCAQQHAAGHRIVIVTSGAIAAGREHLGYPELPATIASKQLLAAVGQSRLIQLWEQLFSIYGIHVGQMLLTRADLEDRERFLNARDTMTALLDNRIVPVINENDAVATAEIKVGDNDNLSALAAILAGADKLLLLTDQQGLYTADPRNNPQAELIREVHGIDDALRAIAGDSVSGLGTGGMGTKLQAADVACRAGIDVVIAAGSKPGVVADVIEGKPVGTRFHALETPLENRKRWIRRAAGRRDHRRRRRGGSDDGARQLAAAERHPRSEGRLLARRSDPHPQPGGARSGARRQPLQQRRDAHDRRAPLAGNQRNPRL